MLHTLRSACSTPTQVEQESSRGGGCREEYQRNNLLVCSGTFAQSPGRVEGINSFCGEILFKKNPPIADRRAHPCACDTLVCTHNQVLPQLCGCAFLLRHCWLSWEKNSFVAKRRLHYLLRSWRDCANRYLLYLPRNRQKVSFGRGRGMAGTWNMDAAGLSTAWARQAACTWHGTARGIDMARGRDDGFRTD